MSRTDETNSFMEIETYHRRSYNINTEIATHSPGQWNSQHMLKRIAFCLTIAAVLASNVLYPNRHHHRNSYYLRSVRVIYRKKRKTVIEGAEPTLNWKFTLHLPNFFVNWTRKSISFFHFFVWRHSCDLNLTEWFTKMN